MLTRDNCLSVFCDRAGHLIASQSKDGTELWCFGGFTDKVTVLHCGTCDALGVPRSLNVTVWHPTHHPKQKGLPPKVREMDVVQ